MVRFICGNFDNIELLKPTIPDIFSLYEEFYLISSLRLAFLNLFPANMVHLKLGEIKAQHKVFDRLYVRLHFAVFLLFFVALLSDKTERDISKITFSRMPAGIKNTSFATAF